MAAFRLPPLVSWISVRLVLTFGLSVVEIARRDFYCLSPPVLFLAFPPYRPFRGRVVGLAGNSPLYFRFYACFQAR